MSTDPEDVSTKQVRVLRAIQELRDLSVALTLLTETAAGQMGINATDLQSLNVIHQLGSPTAGEVARRVGLSTSSMTGAIDRLERAGYVERVADPADRRRIRLRPTAKAGEQAALLFVPQLRDLGEVYARYSAADLQTITEFLEQTHQLISEQTKRLMEPPTA